MDLGGMDIPGGVEIQMGVFCIIQADYTLFALLIDECLVVNTRAASILDVNSSYHILGQLSLAECRGDLSRIVVV